MNINRVLGAAAVTLAALAAIAGTPTAHTRGEIDVDQLASIVTHEQDHVDAIDLAEWIRDQKSGLRVVDVRTQAAFEDYHVPSAENIALAGLSRARFNATDTIVLYSQGGAHAAQAWVLLRALGFEHVYFLSGGLDEWASDVMSPYLPDDATALEKAAFERTATLSRYFGGRPRTGPRAESDTPAGSDGLVRLRRRGC